MRWPSSKNFGVGTSREGGRKTCAIYSFVCLNPFHSSLPFFLNVFGSLLWFFTPILACNVFPLLSIFWPIFVFIFVKTISLLFRFVFFFFFPYLRFPIPSSYLLRQCVSSFPLFSVSPIIIFILFPSVSHLSCIFFSFPSRTPTHFLSLLCHILFSFIVFPFLSILPFLSSYLPFPSLSEHRIPLLLPSLLQKIVSFAHELKTNLLLICDALVSLVCERLCWWLTTNVKVVVFDVFSRWNLCLTFSASVTPTSISAQFHF